MGRIVILSSSSSFIFLLFFFLSKDVVSPCIIHGGEGEREGKLARTYPTNVDEPCRLKHGRRITNDTRGSLRVNRIGRHVLDRSTCTAG